MTELARLLSGLLEYPVAHPRDMLGKIRSARSALAAETCSKASRPEERDSLAKAGAALAGLEAYYENAALSDLQAAHVALFDLKPECSLYLAWHKYGDSPKQGRALAALTGLYREYGFELAGTDLPDYLPILLEFMTAAPAEASGVIMDGFGLQLAVLAEKIGGSDTGYAHAGHCLAALEACLAPDGAASLSAPSLSTAHFKGGPPCMAG